MCNRFVCYMHHLWIQNKPKSSNADVASISLPSNLAKGSWIESLTPSAPVVTVAKIKGFSIPSKTTDSSWSAALQAGGSNLGFLEASP